MLGEEEELPAQEAAPARRGPYQSPALPTVAAPRGKKPAKASDASSSNGAGHSGGASNGGGSASTKRAEHEQRLEQIMAQVAQLEEQGRLVEASELMASQFALPGHEKRKDRQPQWESEAEQFAGFDDTTLPPPPAPHANAWPEPPGTTRTPMRHVVAPGVVAVVSDAGDGGPGAGGGASREGELTELDLGPD